MPFGECFVEFLCDRVLDLDGVKDGVGFAQRELVLLARWRNRTKVGGSVGEISWYWMVL